MKKVIFFLTVYLLALNLQAQKSKITGSWLMTKVETAEGVQNPNFITDFNPDGTMLVMGIPVGTWKYDEASGSIVMQSKMDKDFNGPSKIEKLTKKELVVSKESVKMYYERINRDEIKKNNASLQIEGVWHGNKEDGGELIIRFASPDSLLIVSTGDGSIDRSTCKWIYNPKDETMIIMGFSREIRGKCHVKLNGDKFTMNFDKGKVLSFTKEPRVSVERLTFKDDEFSDESPDEDKLPWYREGMDNMVSALLPVKELKFRKGALLPDMDAFIYATYISKVTVKPDEPRVVFTNLSVENGDTMQYSQDVKGNLQNSYNLFFPFEDIYLYRVTGKETVKVPAGEFNCTVVEGIDGETKVKLWMIDNLPGVYAKIIRDEFDPFGKVDYTVKELTEVVKK